MYFIPPGQSWSNGYIESFNSRVHDECLNINFLRSLAQARVVISDWKADYDHRHSGLGYQAPAVCAAARTHSGSTLTDCSTFVTSAVAIAYQSDTAEDADRLPPRQVARELV